MPERKNVRGRIDPNLIRFCLSCGKEISIHRNSDSYCSLSCNKKGHVRFFSMIKSIRDNMYDPIFQGKQLGLFTRKYHREKGNYYKDGIELNV